MRYSFKMWYSSRDIAHIEDFKQQFHDRFKFWLFWQHTCLTNLPLILSIRMPMELINEQLCPELCCYRRADISCKHHWLKKKKSYQKCCRFKTCKLWPYKHIDGIMTAQYRGDFFVYSINNFRIQNCKCECVEIKKKALKNNGDRCNFFLYKPPL